MVTEISTYGSRFIANSGPCVTTELSIILTSYLTAIKNPVVGCCETVFERHGWGLYWSVKNSGFFFDKLKSKGFLASGVSTCGFSALYAALPHNLIKGKLTELVGGLWTEGARFVWLVVTGVHCSLLGAKRIKVAVVSEGLWRSPLPFRQCFYGSGLWVFLWVLVVLVLLPICYFVVREN